jgi:hypothetical protein
MTRRATKSGRHASRWSSEPCSAIHSPTSARALARVMVESAARKWRSHPKPSNWSAHSSDGGSISNGERPSQMTILPAKAKRPE